MIEEKEYDVEITVTFKTNIIFANIERKRELTPLDAYHNFMGIWAMGKTHGANTLEEVINATNEMGEMHASITSMKVKELV